MVLPLICETVKQGYYLLYLPSKVKNEVQMRLFIFMLLTLQTESVFHFIQNLVIIQCEDSNTKLYFKNYRNTNDPNMVPTEQFFQMLIIVTMFENQMKMLFPNSSRSG